MIQIIVLFYTYKELFKHNVSTNFVPDCRLEHNTGKLCDLLFAKCVDFFCVMQNVEGL